MAIVRESFLHQGLDASGSHAISAPSGLTTGDVVVLHFAMNGSGGVTPPDGNWQALYSDETNNNPRHYAFAAYYDDVGGGTWSFSTGTVYGTCTAVRYSGVDATTMQDTTGAGSGGGPGTTFSLTGVTTTTDGCMIVAQAGANSSSADRMTWDGSQVVSEYDEYGLSSTYKNLSVADGIQSSAGATGSITGTINSSLAWAGGVAALRPASGGGGTTYYAWFDDGGSGHDVDQSGADLTFTGARPVAKTSRGLTANLSPSAALSRTTNRVLEAAAALLSFTPVFSTQYLFKQLLTATLSFSATTTKRTRRSLAGALSPAGAITRRTRRALTGSISPSGAIRRQTGKRFSGAINPSASIAKRARKPLAGSITPGGSVSTRSVLHRALTASLDFAGSIVKASTHSLSGALSFVGEIATSTALAKTFSAALSFAGSLATTSVFHRALTATLSFSGTLSRLPRKALTASLTFAGLFTSLPKKALTGAVSFVGSLSSQSTLHKALTASLTFATSLSRTAHLKLEPAAAVLSFTGGVVGNLLGSMSKSFNATLTFAGSITRSTAHSLTGSLSFTGNVAKQLPVALTATLDFAATIAKRSARVFTAALSPTGAIVRKTSRTLSGGLDFTGTLSRSTRKAMVAALTFAGAVTTATMKRLAGALTFTGNLARQSTLHRAFTATLDFTGSLGSQLIGALSASFNATLSFAGTITRNTSRSLTGTLDFSGAAVKQAQRALTASLDFTGAISRSVAKALAGVLDFAGSLSTASAEQFTQAFTAALSFSGGIVRQTAKALAGTLSFQSFSDTFTRTVTDGWGNGWTMVGGYANTISVDGAKALFIGTWIAYMRHEHPVVRDVDVSFTFSISAVAAATHVLNLCARATGTVVYSAQLYFRNDGTFNGDLLDADGAISGWSPGGISFEYGTDYKLRLQVFGASPTTIRARWWKASDSEPDTWDLEVQQTKASHDVAGGIQINWYVQNGDANGPFTYTNDDVEVSHVVPLSKQTSRSLTGALSFTGSIVKQTRHVLTAVLDFAGLLGKGYTLAFTATLDFAGDITSRIVRYVGRKGVITATVVSKAAMGGLQRTGQITSTIVSKVTGSTKSTSEITSTVDEHPIDTETE